MLLGRGGCLVLSSQQVVAAVGSATVYVVGGPQYKNLKKWGGTPPFLAYVTCDYDSKLWVAHRIIILKHDDTELVSLSFLHPHGPLRSFKYPSRPDILRVSCSYVQTKVTQTLQSVGVGNSFFFWGGWGGGGEGGTNPKHMPIGIISQDSEWINLVLVCPILRGGHMPPVPLQFLHLCKL